MYVLLLLLLLCLLFSATTSRATKRPWLTKPLDDSRYCTSSTMEPKILFLDNCKYGCLLWLFLCLLFSVTKILSLDNCKYGCPLWLLLCLLFSATTSCATKRPWLTKPLDDSRYCTFSTMEPKILFLDNCKYGCLLWQNYSTFSRVERGL